MTDFDIEHYLNSMPEDIETIEVERYCLTYLPSLKRFYKLKKLYCSFNRLTVLPELNPSLQHLYCGNNKLTSLPELNSSLRVLYCENNKLTALPELNDSLEHLNCARNHLTVLPELNNSLRELRCQINQLTYLPKLNNSLKVLFCGNNKLTYIPKLIYSLEVLSCFNNKLTCLPYLNKCLKILICYDNPMPDKLICNGPLTRRDIDETNNDIRLIHKTFNIMCLKYKKHFHRWLWKSRESKIQQKYNPENLINLLKDIDENDEEIFHDVLESW